MADIWYDVDSALAEVPVNLMPLIDDTDFKAIEGAVTYNQAGLALFWHFVTTAGAYTVTAVTPTDTGGNYDWQDPGTAGVYTIEIPASGGASINNDTEGFGWFTGVATGILPWRSAVYGFRAAAINNSLIDGATVDVNVTAMANNVITANAINADAITNAKIADDAIAAENLATGALTADAFAADAIVAATLATGALTADAFAADALVAATFATDCISADALKTDALAEIADAVWDEVVTTGAHDTATFAGAGLIAAASAGDPWAMAIPGAYGAGTAGLLLGTTIPNAIDAIDNYLDDELAAITAAVITNAAGTDVAADIIALQAAVDAFATDGDIAAAVRTELTTELARIDAATSTRAAETGGALAGLATTVGVAGAGLTGITGAKLHADYDAAKTAAPAGAKMDLVDAPNSTAVTAIQSGLATAAKLLAYVKSIMRKDQAADADIAGTYDATTDSLQAIRDTEPMGTAMRGTDGANTTTPPSTADIKTAMEAVGSHLTLIKAETDKLATAMEADAAVYRFTTNALEQAPTGSGSGASLEDIEGSTVLAKEATVDAVDAKVSALGASVVTVTSPVSVDASTVTLVCGDDYYDADGRALTFTDSGGTYPAFTAGTCKLTVRNLATGADTETTGTIVDANTVRFELSKAATGAWTAGGKYRFDVEVTLLNGHEITLATGVVTMLAKYSG